MPRPPRRRSRWAPAASSSARGPGDGRPDRIEVTADSRTPEGSVVRWKIVNRSCAVEASPDCLGTTDPDCEEPPAAGYSSHGWVVTCIRVGAGITIRSGSGDDRVELLTTGDEQATSEGVAATTS